MKGVIEKLTQRQSQLGQVWQKCRMKELSLERQLQEAREARAACEGAKQQVDETLNMLLEVRDAAPV